MKWFSPGNNEKHTRMHAQAPAVYKACCMGRDSSEECGPLVIKSPAIILRALDQAVQIKQHSHYTLTTPCSHTPLSGTCHPRQKDYHHKAVVKNPAINTS